MQAFLMTWSPTSWPYEQLLLLLENFQSGERVVEWRILAHRRCGIGDRAFFFKQGAGEKGIFGYGTIAGVPVKKLGVGDESPKYYVPVQLDNFRDPLRELLIHGDKIKGLVRANTQASGIAIDSSHVPLLDRLLLDEPYLVPESLTKTGPGIWTKDELEIAVDAYLEMLKYEQGNQHYSKSEIRKRVLPIRLVNRSAASFEWRMSNIAAVMVETGRPIVSGYKPALNIGANSLLPEIVRIKYFEQFENQLLNADEVLLSFTVRELMTKPILKPPGKIFPAPVETRLQNVYLRDAVVKAWVLQQANGICEGCNEPAPFNLPGGLPFLEVHHMKPLSENGTDSVENAIALCPNCHRRCHYSEDKDTFVIKLYNSVKRLRVEGN